MKIIFAGTPEFAKIQLQTLIDAQAKNDFQIVAVYTQPDRPVGRGLKIQPSPVKECALKAHLPIEQPLNFKQEETLETLRAYKPDLIIVSAYGLLLPKSVLAIPRLGCWNVHASLLPRWRGAAPIQQAILAGDTQTGITLMQMNEGLDTGDMLAHATLAITPTDTSASLHEKLSHLGADLLLDYLLRVMHHPNTVSAPIAQDNELTTLAPKINKAQAQLDWHQDSKTLLRAIQAFNPWPIAYTNIQNTVVKIWEAQIQPADDASPLVPPGTIVRACALGIDVATGKGLLRLIQIQLPNKRHMPVSEILNAKKELFAVGTQFYATP